MALNCCQGPQPEYDKKPEDQVKRRAGFNFTGPLSGFANSILQRFGVKAAGGQAINPKTGKRSVVTVQANVMPISIQLWLGARLPFAAFVTILVCFTYVYHIVPIVPWLLVLFGITFAMVVCWPPKKIHSGGHKIRRSFSDWAPMYSWAFALSCGVFLGHINHGLLDSWISTTFLHVYKDVQPSIDPMAVSDAGALTFSPGTRLDTSSGAGFKFWFYNYCAAPIVSGDAQAAPINFWAVGVGCCKSRGDFTCGAAADKAARSGIPLRPHNLGTEITDHYHHAIRMSAAANKLEVGKEPVFVVWHADPIKAGKTMWWTSTVLLLILTVIALCSCCACQSGLMHISVMQQSLDK